LEIHKLTTYKVLDSEKSGHFRKVPVVVRNMRTKEISFTPPMSGEVPHLVKEFILWLNSHQASGIHPIIKAGITHYELARIHPFADGNGRAARAMSTLVLFLGGFDVKKFFSLEEYFDKESRKYYEALQKVSNQKVSFAHPRDLTPWLEYFTFGLAQELSKVKEKVMKLSADFKLKGKVGQLSLSERQAKLVEYMQDYGKVTNADWRRLLPNVSDDTVLRDLKDLIIKKLVKKKGSTKKAVYVLK
jgi:Fic family protein